MAKVPGVKNTEKHTEYRDVDICGVYTTTSEDNKTHEKTTGHGWTEKEATSDLHRKLKD